MNVTRDATELAARLRLALVPLHRTLRRQNGPDLTPSLASALASIARHGSLTVGELADVEHVTSPMITKVAKALEEAGLVERQAEPADRRVSRLAITRAGRQRLEASRTRKDAWLANRLRDLDEGELAAIEAAIPVIERLTGGGDDGLLDAEPPA